MIAVYALVDPTTKRVKYVGASVDVEARIAAHIAGNGGSTAGWVGSLGTAGPIPVILQEVSADLLLSAERTWIQMFSRFGALINCVKTEDLGPSVRREILVEKDVADALCARAIATETPEDSMYALALKAGAKALIRAHEEIVSMEAARALGAKTASKAAKASWAGLTPEERRKRASDNRRKGWERIKAAKAAQEGGQP